MADQKRWFKVWTSLIVDMDRLPNEVIGAWTRLGCRAALVGNGGVVTFDNWTHLAAFWRVSLERAKVLATRLPSVLIEEGASRHGALSVTFKNWVKYQEDSTQAERAKASRRKRRGEKTRQEERRGERPPPPIAGGSDAPARKFRPVPKFGGRVGGEYVRVGRERKKIPAFVRPVVSAWSVGFTVRFGHAPEPPAPWDIDAAADLVERHGLERVLRIVEGALRVGTKRMRAGDRWSLQAIQDDWNVLVAMQAKGELL